MAWTFQVDQVNYHTNSNSVTKKFELFGFAGETESAFAENVAHYV